MDKTSLYIQKVIVLFLISTIGVFLYPFIKIYFLLPALFFTLAFLVSAITGLKPDFLFGIAKADDFLNKKAGFWVLFKWILVLFGLIYDFIAWTIFGVYVLFTIILDLILLIKTVLFWIFHAILWLFKQFVPPLVFIFKMKIHYIFRWIWWIYKLSFSNIGISINRNFYFISLTGTVLMLFVMLLFYGAGLLIGISEIFVVGAVFAVLPLVWSYGEISSLRFQQTESDSYQHIRSRFGSGFDAVKAVLSYFVVFLILALTEVFFNILGWIPQVGFSFMGLALNINTLASLILIFLFVILLFAKLIMPPHVVYHKDFNADINGSLVFLGVIGKRFLRYIVSFVPTGFFGALIMVIPAFIVFLSILLTLNIKNSILDTRISILNQRHGVLEGIPRYQTEKEIKRLAYYKDFPKNVIADFGGLKFLSKDVQNLKKNILQREKEMASLRIEFTSVIDSLDKKRESLKSLPMADSSSKIQLTQIEILRHTRLDTFSKWEQDGEYSISKMKVDLSDKQGLTAQLPVVFLLTIIWLSFFMGLVVAFLVSYLGNVYFELYNFKEDNKPTYFNQVLSEINAKDRNQPLLGFTLIFFFVAALLYFVKIKGFLALCLVNCGLL